MTRKTALKRMINGGRVIDLTGKCIFWYDESKEKQGEQAIRVLCEGKELGGVLAFYFAPNLGWKEYRV